MSDKKSSSAASQPSSASNSQIFSLAAKIKDLLDAEKGLSNKNVRELLSAVASGYNLKVTSVNAVAPVMRVQQGKAQLRPNPSGPSKKEPALKKLEADLKEILSRVKAQSAAIGGKLDSSSPLLSERDAKLNEIRSFKELKRPFRADRDREDTVQTGAVGGSGGAKAPPAANEPDKTATAAKPGKDAKDVKTKE